MLGWEPIRGISSSAKLLLGDRRRGGVNGPSGDVGVGFDGRVGRDRRGGGVSRPSNRPLEEGVVGKNCFLRGREEAGSLECRA